jgi:uncharacterized protein
MSETKSNVLRIAKSAPWYADGLHFECLPECGQCCTTRGEFAYVYFENDDLEKLATFLGLSVEACADKYTVLDEGERMLKMDQPTCPFLEGWKCGVYPARPTQCRTFPFWPENLKSKAAWDKLQGYCPGIDRGPLHPLAMIRSTAAEHRSD